MEGNVAGFIHDDDDEVDILMVVAPSAVEEAAIVFDEWDVVCEGSALTARKYELIVIATRIVNVKYEGLLKLALARGGMMVRTCW